MTKYSQLYKEMREQNKELFNKFKSIHILYEKDEKQHQNQFNHVGQQVVDLIREKELYLTAKSQNGQYAKYAANLADKFWNKAREDFPLIDFVGTKII